MASENLERPAEAAQDRTNPQAWVRYTATDHTTWDPMFNRQGKILPGRVVLKFLDGLDISRTTKPAIALFEALNERLMNATGWQVVVVPRPVRLSFEHLTDRRFVTGRFIHSPEQIDYAQAKELVS